ncbi:hypothetical protein EVAR_61698_1 [Eumeta japonica]|uniref:Uncharacterized protein n=1 Tax=Eumeta variegata TaxID=151549 RepID=A0A4C1ZPN1_EUMVA|nr:hypothetical protein EVAR_61698_1 [Eumeta japonica]
MDIDKHMCPGTTVHYPSDESESDFHPMTPKAKTTRPTLSPATRSTPPLRPPMQYGGKETRANRYQFQKAKAKTTCQMMTFSPRFHHGSKWNYPTNEAHQDSVTTVNPMVTVLRTVLEKHAVKCLAINGTAVCTRNKEITDGPPACVLLYHIWPHGQLPDARAPQNHRDPTAVRRRYLRTAALRAASRFTPRLTC